MTPITFAPNEQKLFSAFNKHKIRFLIVGLTSAILQGAHVATQDIDLWIDDIGSPSFLKALEEIGAFYIPPATVGLNPPMLGPNEFRVFDLVTHMHGLDSFDEEYDNAIVVPLGGIEISLLPLERIILSKETADREKDRAALPALRTCLKVKNEQ